MFSIPGRFRSLRKRWMLARFKRKLRRAHDLTAGKGVCRCDMCFKRIEPRVRRLQLKTHLLQVKINRLYPGTLREQRYF